MFIFDLEKNHRVGGSHYFSPDGCEIFVQSNLNVTNLLPITGISLSQSASHKRSESPSHLNSLGSEVVTRREEWKEWRGEGEGEEKSEGEGVRGGGKGGRGGRGGREGIGSSRYDRSTMLKGNSFDGRSLSPQARASLVPSRSESSASHAPTSSSAVWTVGRRDKDMSEISPSSRPLAPPSLTPPTSSPVPSLPRNPTLGMVRRTSVGMLR